MEDTQDAAPSSTEPSVADAKPEVVEVGTAVVDPTNATASNAAVASGDPSSDSTSSDAQAVAQPGELGQSWNPNVTSQSVSPSEDTADVQNASATGTSVGLADTALASGTPDDASGEPGNVGAGTLPAESATPATAEHSVSRSSAEVALVGEPVTNQPSPSCGDSGASTSAGDSGELPAEEHKDSGTPSPSSFTADAAQGGNLGNQDGPADSAATAISPEAALAGIVETTAAAFSVDLEQHFETRHYPDGSTIKTVGALPDASPVSYPTTAAEPAVDTAHGLLNAIEHYLTTALRSSRTDGHKLIAQLRSML